MVHKEKITLYFLLFFILLFLLNDFVYIFIKGTIVFYGIDYLFRIIILVICIMLLKNQICTPGDYGFKKMPLKPFLLWTIILSVTGVLINQLAWGFFDSILPDFPFIINFPMIPNTFFRVFDLIVGIVLVAVTEEIVFRGLFLTIFEKYIKNRTLLVVLSCVVFGIVHWSPGPHDHCFTHKVDYSSCYFSFSHGFYRFFRNYPGNLVLVSAIMTCSHLWPCHAFRIIRYV